MADENLRLRAEVVDAFSGPLRTLRTMLQGVTNTGATEKLKSGMEGAKTAASALGREVNSTLTPALSAMGIAGLTVSGILAGVGASLRAFTGTASTLQLLSRETNMAVDSMRVLEEVGKRFDLAPQAMQQSFRAFAENSRLLKKGIGDVTVFLQSQSPAVAQWGAQLQKDLAAGLNPDVAYRRALEFMRRIRDPIERGMFAEKVFGNRQLGILGSEDIGKMIDEVEKKLGRLPKGAAEAALEFKRFWDDLITSMIRLRDTAGITIMPMLKDITDATTRWLNEPGVRDGMATAFRDLQKALADFNWDSFKADVSGFFKMIVSEGKGAVEMVRLFAQVVTALREGRVLDALKLLDSKPVLPQGMLGDPTAGRISGLERRKDQVERLLQVFDANPANRRDPGGAASRDRLVKELESLTREIEQLRKQQQDATVQQQSLTGDGAFGGARLQMAAFGGMARAGGMVSALPAPYRSGGSVPRIPLTGGGSAGSPYANGKFVGTGDHTLDAIIAAEGTAKGGRDPFNTVLGYGKYGTPPKPLTEMTLREAYAFGREVRRRHGSSSALGAFQIVGQTMKDVGMPDTGLTWDDKFSAENQMKMAQAIRRRQGLGAWEGFKLHPDQLAKARRGGTYALPSREDRSMETARQAQAATERGIAFNETIEALKRQPRQGPVWDAARGSMGGPTTIEGSASLDINLRGFPPGTSTSSTMDGMFKNLRLRKGASMPKAAVDG